MPNFLEVTITIQGGVSMAHDPTIPWYASDFYMDTIQLDERLIGAYTRLLCALWLNKFCHYSATALANISPSAKEVVDLLKCKFTFYDDGTFTSNRLEEEREKRLHNREIRQESGKKGAESRWQRDSKDNGKGIAKIMAKEDEKEDEKDNESENTNEIKISPKQLMENKFNVFWISYPKKML